MLVEAGMRYGKAGLVQQCRALQVLDRRVRRVAARIAKELAGHCGNALRVLAIDVIAREELRDGCVARIAFDRAAQEIVEHAQSQRAADGIDPSHVELRERGAHDCESARKHGRTLGLQRSELQRLTCPAVISRWRTVQGPRA